MMKVNINYPTKRFIVHSDPGCTWYMISHDRGARHLQLNRANISTRLAEMRRRVYPFAATKGLNALWLEIDFATDEEAMDVAQQAKEALGSRYKRIREADVLVHCHK